MRGREEAHQREVEELRGRLTAAMAGSGGSSDSAVLPGGAACHRATGQLCGRYVFLPPSLPPSPPPCLPPSAPDLTSRLVELSTHAEDLQYQLSCCQGQLEQERERAEGAEVRRREEGRGGGRMEEKGGGTMSFSSSPRPRLPPSQSSCRLCRQGSSGWSMR